MMISSWTPPEVALRMRDRKPRREPDEDEAYERHRQRQVDDESNQEDTCPSS